MLDKTRLRVRLAWPTRFEILELREINANLTERLFLADELIANLRNQRELTMRHVLYLESCLALGRGVEDV